MSDRIEGERPEDWKLRTPEGSKEPPPMISTRRRELRDGEPCEHGGCLSHVSHPCDGCGRIGGRAPTPSDTPKPPETTQTVSGKFGYFEICAKCGIRFQDCPCPAAPQSPMGEIEKAVDALRCAAEEFGMYRYGQNEADRHARNEAEYQMACAESSLLSLIRSEIERESRKVHRKQEKIHEQVETIAALRSELESLRKTQLTKEEARLLLATAQNRTWSAEENAQLDVALQKLRSLAAPTKEGD